MADLKRKIILLESKKEALFQRMQELYDLSLDVSNPAIQTKFLSRVQSLEKTRTDFLEIVDDLNLLHLKQDEEVKPNYAVINAFDDLYCRVLAAEKSFTTPKVNSERNKFEFTRKLPPLELASFDGSPNKWPVFYQNFKNLIHENTVLSTTEKAQYLIGKLSGKALTICSGIPPTGENYIILWNNLVEKYHDVRVQASMYLEQMLHFKSQSSDAFIEQFCSAEAALRRLEVDDLSDFIINHIALSKLDKDTLTLFEQSHRHVKIPSFAQLKQFIKEQNKIHSLRSSYTNTKPTYANHKQNTAPQSKYTKSTHSFVTSINTDTAAAAASNSSQTQPNSSSSSLAFTPRSCQLCKTQPEHALYRCSYFLSQNAHTRNSLVNKHNFCRNCLGFHNINDCKSQNYCSICQRKHHTLIHIDNFRQHNSANNNHVNKNYSSKNTSIRSNITPQNQLNDVNNARLDTAAPRAMTATVVGTEPTLLPALFVNKTAQAQTEQNNLSLSVISDSSILNYNKNTTVLLPTASVYTYGKDNKCNKLRVFLDTGSMSHFITKECCERLKLKVNPNPTTIKGIGRSESTSFGTVSFKIHSRFDDRCVYTIQACVIDSITDHLPNAPIDLSQLTHLQDLPMADDNFFTPADIDCLLGNELFPLLLGSKKVTSPHSSVVGVETTLGFIAMGRASCNLISSVSNNKTFLCNVESPSLDTLTQRFWELETVPNKKHLSSDDKECQNIFQSTYSLDPTGTYTVQLPFKSDASKLGDSYSTAKRRLFILERKLNANPEIRKDYNATIRDYIDRGFLSKVENPRDVDSSYYIPHRAVYRPDKTTSKTRIVLDASCKTTSGKSLNDLLFTGPNLQQNIFDLLINLRIFSIALSADIEKMYFCVKLAPCHQPFQRILYRFDSESPIEVYQFNRVSFGVSSSPYLAMRVVRQLAADERNKYPMAAFEAEHRMFMDDYVSSVDGISRAEQTYDEMVKLFMAGGFKLVKWVSNSAELMTKIPHSHKSPQLINFDSDSNVSTKIIGMQWQPIDDVFQFTTHDDEDSNEYTKRTILSATARLFDPLGLLGPVTAFMKLLVQECWQLQLSWDDPVPDPIKQKWIQFRRELTDLMQIKIPRHVGISAGRHVTILGFADASEQCYGAVVHIRVSSSAGSPGTVNLLTSKSRVAPLKKISLARLELCAALLLANVIASVRDKINERCPINSIYAFSDSTVALTWIHSPAFKFHTFVANRITEINDKLSSDNWYHVSGNENPADIISRPLTPKLLLDKPIWFEAPQWASRPISEWPIQPFIVSPKEDSRMEEKTVALVTETNILENHPIALLIERISSYKKLLRATVYVLRFAKILKTTNTVTPSDLDYAEIYLIRHVQNLHFTMDIHALKNNKRISKKLLKLNPFIDSDNIIRVGGRLAHSQLNHGQKHPIILPPKHRLTQLIVDHYHVCNLHTGPSLLLSLLRQKFWILAARNLVRQTVHQCNICFKNNPKSPNPFMGDLPYFRVSEAKAFVFTSVDYAGPFFITHIRRRGIKSQKAYLCLFCCLSTKAVHLELVSDLSSDLFLAAFNRFISRRGPVSILYSDGGTNFLGAQRKLNEIYTLLESESHKNYIGQHLADQRIKFIRSPPYGPHFNGLAEINVRCVKTHLYKVIGLQILTYEEFNSILVQIEGLLNSRPLCVLSSDPSNLSTLTPNHFLNVTPLKFLPSEDVTSISDNRLARYQLVNKVIQSFWRRWSQEYLTSLQQREKWNTMAKPIELGSVVVIKDNNTHPLCWPLGVVEELYSGKDGITRTLKVRTAAGSYVRPVVRVCPLPLQ